MLTRPSVVSEGLDTHRKALAIDRDDGVFIKTKIVIEHVMDLPANHHCADDKDQAHRELEDDKALAEIAFGIELPDARPAEADHG